MILIPGFNPNLQLIELETGGGHIVRAIREYRQQEPTRTGVHCSTIINDIVRTMYPAKFKTVFTEEDRLAYQEIGNIIEDVIAMGCRRRWKGWMKPKPRIHRGVWCSPDGWHRPTRAIHEIKATWVGQKEFQDSVKLMTYCLQALAYAYVWHAARVLLHIFFVCKHYPPVPTPRTFILKWKDRSVLEQNWRTIEQHGQDMKLLRPRS